MPAFRFLQDMVQRVRKCRLMGSAALDMAYVACGRFDAYIERRHQSLGRRCRLAPGRKRGRQNRDAFAYRTKRQIQRRCFQRRDRLSIVIL